MGWGGKRGGCARCAGEGNGEHRREGAKGGGAAITAGRCRLRAPPRAPPTRGQPGTPPAPASGPAAAPPVAGVARVVRPPARFPAAAPPAAALEADARARCSCVRQRLRIPCNHLGAQGTGEGGVASGPKPASRSGARRPAPAPTRRLPSAGVAPPHPHPPRCGARIAQDVHAGLHAWLPTPLRPSLPPPPAAARAWRRNAS